jgi:hypothetical protein
VCTRAARSNDIRRATFCRSGCLGAEDRERGARPLAQRAPTRRCWRCQRLERHSQVDVRSGRRALAAARWRCLADALGSRRGDGSRESGGALCLAAQKLTTRPIPLRCDRPRRNEWTHPGGRRHRSRGRATRSCSAHGGDERISGPAGERADRLATHFAANHRRRCPERRLTRPAL